MFMLLTYFFAEKSDGRKRAERKKERVRDGHFGQSEHHCYDAVLLLQHADGASERRRVSGYTLKPQQICL